MKHTDKMKVSNTFRLFNVNALKDKNKIEQILRENKVPFQKFDKKISQFVNCILLNDEMEYPPELNIQLPLDVSNEKVLFLFADGACKNNGYRNPNLPMYGSSATRIIYNENCIYENTEIYKDATNNVAELMAVINGFRWLNIRKELEYSHIIVISDSSYVIRGSSIWIHDWYKKDGLTHDGKEIKNLEYWSELFSIGIHNTKFYPYFLHVKAHTGNDDFYSVNNNLCDEAAQKILRP